MDQDIRGMSIDAGGVTFSPEPDGSGLIVDGTVTVTQQDREWEVPASLDAHMKSEQLRELAQWCLSLARQLEREALKNQGDHS